MTDAHAVPTAEAAAPLRWVMGGSIAMAVAIGVGRFLYTPILPPMVAALGLSRFVAGLIASANFAGYLAGAVLGAGPRLSPRRWILGGLVGSAVTTGAMGLVRTLPMFLILRAAGGVASAIVLVITCAAVLEALAERDRPDLGPFLFAGVGAGIAGSALLVSALRALGLPWPALWMGGAALSLLGVLFCWNRIPARPSTRSTSRQIDHRRLGGRFTRLAVAYGLFGFGYIITATFLVAIVRSNPQTRAIESIVWVVFGCAAIPSVALWVALARRFGLSGAFALAALTEALGVLASVAWSNIVGMLLGSVLAGGTFMGLTALGLLRAQQLAKTAPQRGIALLTVAFGAGQIVGPTLAGALSDRMGSFTVPSLIAAAALVTSAGLIAI